MHGRKLCQHNERRTNVGIVTDDAHGDATKDADAVVSKDADDYHDQPDHHDYDDDDDGSMMM